MNKPRFSEDAPSIFSEKKWMPWTYALITGVTAFLITVGYRALLPTNIAWLSQGDPATGFLGWTVFRNSPWHFPPGANTAYGLEIGNGIIYSDSNPLLAFIFKGFSFLLPDTFQYFGIWILLCFCLQAFFAFKLLSLFSKDSVVTCLASAFLVFSPPMLLRLSGHYNLVAHFLILCSLYLLLKPQIAQYAAKWSITMGVAALIHPYLLAMVGIICTADAISRLVRKEISLVELSKTFMAVSATTIVTSWLAGYFTARDSYSLGGFGLYRMNLLSLIDPMGWSSVLPDLPRGPGDYEGFNFLGLGMLVLFVLSLTFLLANPRLVTQAIKRQVVVLVFLIALTLFAISNKIGIGSSEIEIPIPQLVESLAEVFRSSGRMFWPVFYCLQLTVFYILIRRLRARTLFFVLSAALIVQIIDTSNGWLNNRTALMAAPSSNWPTTLVDPFWEEAALRYDKVRWLLPVFPPQLDLTRWMTVADYAIRNDLSTDAAYLARIDSQDLEQAEIKRRNALDSGIFEMDSLYFLDESQLLQIAINIDPERDLLAFIDGFGVLAPGWKSCSECGVYEAEVALDDLLLEELRPSFSLDFSESGSGSKYLTSGWSFIESEGVWSAKSVARISVPLSGDPISEIVISALPLVSEDHPQQRVSIELNSIDAGTWVLDVNTPQELVVSISAEVQSSLHSSDLLHIVFRLPDAVQPSSIGLNSDTRELGIFLYSLVIR